MDEATIKEKPKNPISTIILPYCCCFFKHWFEQGEVRTATTTTNKIGFLKYMFKERQRKIEDQEASTLTVIGWSFLYKMSLISYVRIQFVIKGGRAKNEYAKNL